MENKTNIKNINPEVYEAVLEALEDHAIVSVTDEKGDILWANNKFLELSKYSLDELVGQNHRILKSGHQPQELFVDLWATISAGKTWPFFIVIPAGIEPASQLPQSCVLSIERRDHVNQESPSDRGSFQHEYLFWRFHIREAQVRVLNEKEVFQFQEVR
jgi:PAS domain-containing protein